jgi:TonB family protein
MKTPRQLLPIVLLAGLPSIPARAGELKLIANPSVSADTISAEEIRKVFLEQKNTLNDGSHVEPVIEKSGRVQAEFLRAYLDRSDDDLRNYYRAMIFTGRGSMPKTLGTDAEVVAYVARTRGAIGYIGAESAADGVKTLAVVEAGNGGGRKLITRVEPEYPETLKNLKIGGTVRVKISIAARGNVENVQVLGGNPILGEAAQTAVKQWVYAPGRSPSTAEVGIPFDPSR